MRSTLATLILGMSLVAGCEVGDTGGGGGGGGGDDQQPAPDAAVTNEPRVTISVDKTTVTTDLTVENVVTVTATSVNGFTGPVNLAATVTDGAGASIAGWAVLATPTLTLAANGTATSEVKIKVPGNAAALAGTLKISGTSAAPAAESTVAITANPVVTVMFNEVGGKCSYPSYPVNSPLRIKAGRMIRVVNNTTQPMTIHVDGTIGGWAHEGGTIANGQAYSGTPNQAGDIGTFYCHAGQNPTTITDAGGTRPNLVVE